MKWLLSDIDLSLKCVGKHQLERAPVSGFPLLWKSTWQLLSFVKDDDSQLLGGNHWPLGVMWWEILHGLSFVLQPWELVGLWRSSLTLTVLKLTWPREWGYSVGKTSPL